MKYKSIVVQKPHNIEIVEKALPKPSAGEIRVKVVLAGICGSDLHIFHGANPFAKYPRVIGHEFFGIIDEVGEGVNENLKGTRVAVDPVVSCGQCYCCKIGKPNVCTTLQVLGVHTDGGFAEYAIVKASNAKQIPSEISDEFAVMIEPFTIGANVTSQVNPTADDVALIYGAGPMGVITAQVLKNVYKVKQLIVTDLIEERLARAKSCGADIVINGKGVNLVEHLANLNIKPTVIIDCACHPSILKQATQIAHPAARIAIMGFSNEPCEISQQLITGKQLSIFSSRLNANKFPVVIEWMQSGLIDPNKLITHRFNWQEVEKALQVFEKDQTNCCKVLLQFQ